MLMLVLVLMLMLVLPVSCLAATDCHTRMWLQADLSGSERLRGGCLLATEDAALADWRHTLLQQLLSVSEAVTPLTPLRPLTASKTHPLFQIVDTVTVSVRVSHSQSEDD